MRRLHLATVMMTIGLAVGMVGFGVAGAQSGTDDPAQLEAGQAVFETNCAGCHGLDGMGSNTGRPLTDVATENERSRHITSVTDGRGNMPAFGGNLAAEDIDAAVTYVRLTFVSEPELAVTGATSLPLAAGGVLLLVVGGVMATMAGRPRRSALG